MAKVRFIVKGNKDIVQLIVRVLVTRNQDFQKGTKIFIPIEYWNKEEKRLYTRKDKTPFKNDADFIKTINQSNNLLNSIENIIVENMSNTDNITPLLIEDVIHKFHGLPTNSEIFIKEKEEIKKIEEENRKKLLNYIIKYNELRINDSSILASTKQKYKYLEKIVNEFELFNDCKLLLNNCDKDFYNSFDTFLHNEKKLMKSTIIRVIKNLKTILYDAQNNGYKISPQSSVPQKRSKEGDVVHLTLEELDIIRSFNVKDETLKITKDWLIIGCFTGQRVSDFMRFNKNCIRTYKDLDGTMYDIIEISQIKTKKRVSIPIHPFVKDIINKNNGFPDLFSMNPESNATIFNIKLKELIELIGITRLVNAKEYDEKEKRNFIRKIPIYKAISSHVCRRSFATNFYGDPKFPTPLIMSITGHRYENTFLEYIGKSDINKALIIAKIFHN